MNTKISINEGVLKGYMTVGVSRHNELTGRDASDQHPIEAITGLQTALTEKQSTLVSGQNIKTINGENILGSGDIAIGSSVSSVNGKVGAVVLSAEDVGALSEETNIPTKTSELINDSGFLTEHQDISGKQDKLTAGEGIAISEDNTISATGGSSDFVAVFYGDDDYRNTSFSEIKNAFDIGRGVKLKDYSNAGPGESEIIEAYLNCSHISETSGTEWFVFTQVSEASVLCIYQVSGDTESGDYEWFSTFDPLQEKLISGSNIKTINNQSLLGNGDLEIGGAVDSVNGKTGKVVLSAEDVGALSSDQTIEAQEKNIATAIIDDSTSIPTTKAVYDVMARKQDKDLIITDTESTSATLELNNNTDYRYTSELIYCSVTFPVVAEDYVSLLTFKSGEAATNFTYPDGIKWTGDNIVEGEFVPASNKKYTICLWYDGIAINGVARGVDI